MTLPNLSHPGVPSRRRSGAIGLAAVLACAGALTACGGGGGDSGPAGPQANEPDLRPQKTAVPVTVIDGPILNAAVCLDIDRNGACDDGEPTARTDVDGKATLQVDPADAGKYPVIALIGTDAVDRDHGPVTVPFTLKAPAGASGVVSPLTTLVQAQIDSSGGTPVEAERLVREQLGLSTSLFSDFSSAGDPASITAANTARMVVVVTQMQNQAVHSVSGSADTGGGTITAQDLERAVSQAVLGMLQAIADAIASQPAGASASELAAAIENSARTLAETAGINADNAAAAVAGSRMPGQAEEATSVAAGWSLRWFQFTDTNNWLVRASVVSDTQAIPDANGLTRYVDHRERAIDGVEQVFGESQEWTRTDLYRDGARWWNCPADFESTQTARDADGTSGSTFCKTIQSISRRSTRDIGGASMAGIVREIRSSPYMDPFGAELGGFAKWGPDPASGLLGTATFPAGSRLYYQSFTDTRYPDAYRPGDRLNVFATEAAGGAGCADAPQAAAATSLEQVIALNSSGTPCSYAASEATGPKNDWWGNNTVAIGPINNTAAAPGDYYAAGRTLRVGFGDGRTARYYSCMIRKSNQSPRNCEAAGSGSYSIETLDDSSRVLRLAGLPAAAASLKYERLLVERDGAVYLGYRNKPVTGNQIRLNPAAANALFTQLGLLQLVGD